MVLTWAAHCCDWSVVEVVMMAGAAVNAMDTDVCVLL
jgi:hypothetical protein